MLHKLYLVLWIFYNEKKKVFHILKIRTIKINIFFKYLEKKLLKRIKKEMINILEKKIHYKFKDFYI